MAAAAQHKIVIVEDEGLIAADLESRLRSAGYQVPGTADSAQPALQLIRETAPDLILMDIRLKGEQDGIQVAEVVREQFDIPVVYLTAYEDRATLDRASRTQAYGYIKKPIVSASLKGSIEMAIAKHHYERGLREERDWAIASFGAVASAVVVTDANSRISYLNSQAEQLVGWSVERALRRPAATVLRLSHRDTGKPVQDLLTPVMLEGQTLPLPPGTLLQGSAERLYAIEGHVSPRWRNGRADGTVITFTDVTLCRFQNDQIRQDHKQEALVRMADGIMRHLPQLDALVEASKDILMALPSGSPLWETAETIRKAALDASALGSHLRSYLQPPELDCQRLRLDEVLKRLAETWKLIHVNFVLLTGSRRSHPCSGRRVAIAASPRQRAFACPHPHAIRQQPGSRSIQRRTRTIGPVGPHPGQVCQRAGRRGRPGTCFRASLVRIERGPPRHLYAGEKHGRNGRGAPGSRQYRELGDLSSSRRGDGRRRLRRAGVPRPIDRTESRDPARAACTFQEHGFKLLPAASKGSLMAKGTTLCQPAFAF